MAPAWMVLPAVVLDRLFGEPQRFHPLVGFGNLAGYIERHFNRRPAALLSRVVGLFAMVVLVAPWVLLAGWFEQRGVLGEILATVLLALAIGWRSLEEHVSAVQRQLVRQDLAGARRAVGMIVSRDASRLDQPGVARAAVESALENSSDALFASLFWFVVAGAPGVVLHRLVNTLDAMWGYRNDRYRYFGWAAARFDDLLNWLPARLTALSFVLTGKQPAQALRCWLQQSSQWDSPNAGVVMASGAGALNLRLGGPDVYHGELRQRPVLGGGRPPAAADIRAALVLVRRALALWLVVIVGGFLVVTLFS